MSQEFQEAVDVSEEMKQRDSFGAAAAAPAPQAVDDDDESGGEPDVPPLFGEQPVENAAALPPQVGVKGTDESYPGRQQTDEPEREGRALAHEAVLDTVAGMEDGEDLERPDNPQEDGDDWQPTETWKVGNSGVVHSSPEKVKACFMKFLKHNKQFEWDDSMLDCCGKVGDVLAVLPDKTLRVNLRVTRGAERMDQVAIVPVQIFRKISLKQFFKRAEETSEELGLMLRRTPYGGLQMEQPEEGSRAAEEGLTEFYGQWLTHVGDTQVMDEDEFTAAEGQELRFERRVTLPYEFARVKLEEKINGAILMSDLRVYILFVIFFVVFFLLDRAGLVEPAFYVTENMRSPALGNEIPYLFTDSSGIGCGEGVHTTYPVRWEKTYMDLANAGDWNAWVLTMALGSLWGEDQFGPVVSGNILLGAVRFRVLRMRNDSCGVNSDIIPKQNSLHAQQVCYSDFNGPYSKGEAKGGIHEEPFYASLFDQRYPEIVYNPKEPDPLLGGYDPVLWTQYRDCGEMNPEASWNPPYTTGQIGLYHCGGYFFEIPWYTNSINQTAPEKTSLLYAQDEYRRRACHGFFDDSIMRLATMELIEYSPTFDSFLSTRMFFEVAAGGAWVPQRQFRTFAVWTATGARQGQTAVDFLFLMCVLYYVGDFFFDARRQYKRKGALLAHILQAWTLLEFLNLALFLTSYGFRFAWWARCLETDTKVDLLRTQGRYPGYLDEIEWLYMMQVYINSCNVIFTFLKLLKYMRLNKRFGILTETLADCQDSIVGVLVIFILVVLAFAVTGNTLFGTQMHEFRSLDASMSTLMRMLMGEFDYEAMKRENRVLAGLFFWSFLVLGLFVLLNFLIGVIAESFGKVSDQIHTEPLDMVFKKTAEDLKILLQPHVLKHYLRMRFVRCHTRETLLEQCADAVGDWRDECYEKVPDEEKGGELRFKEGEEPDCQIINRQEFMGAIRACGDPRGIVMEDIGEDYVGYIWNHLVYEFHRSQEVDTLQSQMRKQSAFQKGCKNALSDKLRIVEQFSARMDALRISLAHMKQLLIERGAM